MRKIAIDLFHGFTELCAEGVKPLLNGLKVLNGKLLLDFVGHGSLAM
jgi:hypothetical protein